MKAPRWWIQHKGAVLSCRREVTLCEKQNQHAHSSHCEFTPRHRMIHSQRLKKLSKSKKKKKPGKLVLCSFIQQMLPTCICLCVKDFCNHMSMWIKPEVSVVRTNLIWFTSFSIVFCSVLYNIGTMCRMFWPVMSQTLSVGQNTTIPEP